MNFGEKKAKTPLLPTFPQKTPMLLGLLDEYWGQMFFAGSRTGYHPWEVERLLMKRLHMPPSEIRKWPLDYRDYMFEKENAEHEAEASNSNTPNKIG